MLNVQQIGQDGIGQEKTVYGSGVRLTAKSLSTTKVTTLRVTGMSSGATRVINIKVKSGSRVRFTPPTPGRDFIRQDTLRK